MLNLTGKSKIPEKVIFIMLKINLFKTWTYNEALDSKDYL